MRTDSSRKQCMDVNGKTEEFQCVFVVYFVLERKRSVLVLRALFTTDPQTHELLLNNSLLELI